MRHIPLLSRAYGRLVLLSFGAFLTIMAAAAHAGGIVGDALTGATSAVAMALIGTALGAALAWAAATSERFAAPARAKSPQDRTLLDKAIIEADKRIDALNRDQLQLFIDNFVASKIDAVIASPVLDPMRQADGYLIEAVDAFTRRNPELAAAMKIDPTSLRELIAAGIGRARKDVLAEIQKAAATPPAVAVATITNEETTR